MSSISVKKFVNQLVDRNDGGLVWVDLLCGYDLWVVANNVRARQRCDFEVETLAAWTITVLDTALEVCQCAIAFLNKFVACSVLQIDLEIKHGVLMRRRQIDEA